MIRYSKQQDKEQIYMNGEPIDMIDLPSEKYVKKPIPVNAFQVFKDFEVETFEGVMSGKANDYVIIGIKGEIYPCKKEIFEESYVEV